LLWEPTTSTTFLYIDKEALPHTSTCSFCKKRKSFVISKSSILIDKEMNEYLKKDILDLEKDLKKLKSRILIPLNGKEWAISISNNHELSLSKISKDIFMKAINLMLLEIKKILGKGSKKHIHCFSLLNIKKEGTLFHPQIRCLAFDHKLLVPLYIGHHQNRCLLCDLFSEYKKMGGEEIIHQSEKFMAVKAIYEENAIYFFSKNHYNYLTLNVRNLTKELAHIYNELINFLSNLSIKKYGLNCAIYISIDFIQSEHIYGKAIYWLPSTTIDEIIRVIISDRKARYVTGPLI